MPANAHLRIHGHGEIEVALVVAYLADIRHAYDSILVFDFAIDNMRRASREFRYMNIPFPLDLDWPFLFGRRLRRTSQWPLGADQITSLVPISQQLRLAAVQLQSPGFWDFLGKLNPLEVVRQYLNDRHERRKDRDYRESAEERRMLLETLSLENRVLSERVKLAKELGASDEDLAPLLNELVYKPLTALAVHQDRGVVDRAELPRPLDEREG